MPNRTRTGHFCPTKGQKEHARCTPCGWHILQVVNCTNIDGTTFLSCEFLSNRALYILSKLFFSQTKLDFLKFCLACS